LPFEGQRIANRVKNPSALRGNASVDEAERPVGCACCAADLSAVAESPAKFEALHYAFDLWIRRNFPVVLFERYADDAICHCRDEDQATALRTALATRFAECELTLNPKKTKIVYCKDQSRRENHPTFKFDFLGYTSGQEW